MTNETVLNKMIEFAREKGKTGVDLKSIDPAKMAQVVKADVSQTMLIHAATMHTFSEFPKLADPKVNWNNDATWSRLRQEILDRIAAKPAQVEVAEEDVDPFADEMKVVVKQLQAGEKIVSEDTETLRDELEMYAARVARNLKVYIYDQEGELNNTGNKLLDTAVKIAQRDGMAKAQTYVDEQIEDSAGYGKARQQLLKALTTAGWTTAGRDTQSDTDHNNKVLGNVDFANAINRLKAGWEIDRVLRALKVSTSSAPNGRPAPKKAAEELDPFASPA